MSLTQALLWLVLVIALFVIGFSVDAEEKKNIFYVTFFDVISVEHLIDKDVCVPPHKCVVGSTYKIKAYGNSVQLLPGNDINETISDVNKR